MEEIVFLHLLRERGKGEAFDCRSLRERAGVLTNSVYFFKHGLPGVEPSSCAKGGMVLHINEEVVSYCGYFENFRLEPGLRSLPPSLLSSFFLSLPLLFLFSI